ncbi:MAG: NAD(P)-dependent oxidoreductase [SAR202 cluster bacterium]|nr:NAD(P)-dependent oxidoreductase [SAR202 cluster bacterium]
MAKKRKVLVTGAAGYIAAQLLPEFRRRYDLVLLDARASDRGGKRVPGVMVVDLIDPDFNKYRHYFKGIDTIIHLGWKHSQGASGALARPRSVDDFYPEHENVHMAYNIYRVAMEEHVQRVVVASSNHAADWYEHELIHHKKLDAVDPYMLPLSDNFYGWAKATYEHMGFMFATGIFGRKLENVQVRIGAPREIRLKDYTKGDSLNYKRDLGAYISPRDLRQLFIKAVETESIENEYGVPWLVVYGISDNARAFWSLTSARDALGYEPQDDSEVKFQDEIQGFLYGRRGKAGPGRVGQ